MSLMMKNNTAKPVMYHNHHERCPKCNSLDSLSLYDNRNKEYNYQLILDTHDVSLLKKNSFRYFKCNKCKEVFNIDWTWCVPVPLDESKVDKFIEIGKELRSKNS